MRLGLYVGLVRMVDDWLGLCRACVEKRTKRELAPISLIKIIKQVVQLFFEYR